MVVQYIGELAVLGLKLMLRLIFVVGYLYALCLAVWVI